MARHAVQATLILAVLLMTAGAQKDPAVMFDENFDKDTLSTGWTWLRENPKAWRLNAAALEIKVEPGDANTVKNALLRDAPDRAKAGARYAIELTVTNLTKPTRQWEQAGLTWYIDGKPIFKLVKELVDGKVEVIPGKSPADHDTVHLRLIVAGAQLTAQYRFDHKSDWKTSAIAKLPQPDPRLKEQISIQCYHGPEDAEHWIRFDDFRIIELPAAH
jgi:hypothetical protein